MLEKELFSLEDISDVPEYSKNTFEDIIDLHLKKYKSLDFKTREDAKKNYKDCLKVYSNNLRKVLLFFLKQSNMVLSTKQIRIAYYRKYCKDKSFIGLPLYHISYLLHNLVGTKDIITVGRGLYQYNKNKKTTNNKIKRQKVKGNLFREKILSVFKKEKSLTKNEIRKLLKNKYPDLELNEGSLSSTLINLRRDNCLKYEKHLYILNKKKYQNKKIINLYKKIDKEKLIYLINLCIPFNMIAPYFHIKEASLRYYIKKEKIKKKKYKGTKIIDLKSKKIWYYKKNCAKDLNITIQKLNNILNGKETLRGFDLKRFNKVKNILKIMNY